MKEDLLQLFTAHPQAALAISLLLNVIIAVLGVVPSVFITAANVLFFGFWPGTAVSFLGEALGAAVSFLLYRKGFKTSAAHLFARYPKAQTLVAARGKKAFLLIVSLRLLPFVPSGLVTFAAAIGTMGFWHFLLASSLGKIPAIVLEAAAVYGAVAFTWPGRLLLLGLAALLFAWVWRRRNL